uniref:Uncharacterized protein n=1 Tax=Ditylenchus dipsaci TaxID=166011 RepID=A0A915CPD0_9BILA
MWDAPLWTLTIALLMFRLGSRKRACIPMRESSQFSHTLRCLLIVSLYLYGNFLLLDGDGRVHKKEREEAGTSGWEKSCYYYPKAESVLIEMKETGNAILSSTEMDLKNVNIICDEKLEARDLIIPSAFCPPIPSMDWNGVLAQHLLSNGWGSIDYNHPHQHHYLASLAAMSSLAYGLIHQQQSNPVMDYTLLNNLINHHYNTNNSVSSKSDGCENHAPADLAAEMNSVLAMHNNIALNPSFLQNSNLFALVSLLICIYHILYIFKSISISGQPWEFSSTVYPSLSLSIEEEEVKEKTFAFFSRKKTTQDQECGKDCVGLGESQLNETCLDAKPSEVTEDEQRVLKSITKDFEEPLTQFEIYVEGTAG